MPTELFLDSVNSYFAALNPIAAKVAADIDDIKSAYEDIFWDKLTASEQVEIVNEALIKPEISLRYFNRFSTSLESILSQNDSANKARKVYNFDGKNLYTYASHRTGSKVLHDAAVRDEHSTPFSYKSRSQINLQLFEERDVGERPALTQSQLMTRSAASAAIAAATNPDADPEQLKTYQKVQTELANSIISSKSNKAKYERFYDEPKTDDPVLPTEAPTATALCEPKPNDEERSKNFLAKLITKTQGQPSKANKTDDDYYEGMNLMANMSYSSSLPSEEDEPDGDVLDFGGAFKQAACEDSRLLLDSNDLCKGFDFLNNW